MSHPPPLPPKDAVTGGSVSAKETSEEGGIEGSHDAGDERTRAPAIGVSAGSRTPTSLDVPPSIEIPQASLSPLSIFPLPTLSPGEPRTDLRYLADMSQYRSSASTTRPTPFPPSQTQAMAAGRSPMPPPPPPGAPLPLPLPPRPPMAELQGSMAAMAVQSPSDGLASDALSPSADHLQAGAATVSVADAAPSDNKGSSPPPPAYGSHAFPENPPPFQPGRFPRWRGWLEKRALDRRLGAEQDAQEGSGPKRKLSWGPTVERGISFKGPSHQGRPGGSSCDQARPRSPLHVTSFGSRFIPQLSSAPLCAVPLSVPRGHGTGSSYEALHGGRERKVLVVGTVEGLWAVEFRDETRGSEEMMMGRERNQEKGWNGPVRCVQVWSGQGVHQLSVLHSAAPPKPATASHPFALGEPAPSSPSPASSILIALTVPVPSASRLTSTLSSFSSSLAAQFSEVFKPKEERGGEAHAGSGNAGHGDWGKNGPSTPQRTSQAAIQASGGGTVRMWNLEAIRRVVAYALDEESPRPLDLSARSEAQAASDDRKGKSLASAFRKAWSQIGEGPYGRMDRDDKAAKVAAARSQSPKGGASARAERAKASEFFVEPLPPGAGAAQSKLAQRALEGHATEGDDDWLIWGGTGGTAASSPVSPVMMPQDRKRISLDGLTPPLTPPLLSPGVPGRKRVSGFLGSSSPEPEPNPRERAYARALRLALSSVPISSSGSNQGSSSSLEYGPHLVQVSTRSTHRSTNPMVDPLARQSELEAAGFASRPTPTVDSGPGQKGKGKEDFGTSDGEVAPQGVKWGKPVLFFSVHQEKGAWYLALATSKTVLLYEAVEPKGEDKRAWSFVKELYAPFPPRTISFLTTQTTDLGRSASTAGPRGAQAASSRHSRTASTPAMTNIGSSSALYGPGALRPGGSMPRREDLSILVTFGKSAVLIRLADSQVREVDLASTSRPGSVISFDGDAGSSVASGSRTRRLSGGAASVASSHAVNKEHWLAAEIVEAKLRPAPRRRTGVQLRDEVLPPTGRRDQVSQPSGARSGQQEVDPRFPPGEAPRRDDGHAFDGQAGDGGGAEDGSDGWTSSDDDNDDDDDENGDAARGFDSFAGGRRSHRSSLGGKDKSIKMSVCLLTKGHQTQVFPLPLAPDISESRPLKVVRWQEPPTRLTAFARIVDVQRRSGAAASREAGGVGGGGGTGTGSTSENHQERKQRARTSGSHTSSSSLAATLTVLLTVVAFLPSRVELRRTMINVEAQLPPRLAFSPGSGTSAALKELLSSSAPVAPGLLAQPELSLNVETEFETGMLVTDAEPESMAPNLGRAVAMGMGPSWERSSPNSSLRTGAWAWEMKGWEDWRVLWIDAQS